MVVEKDVVNLAETQTLCRQVVETLQLVPMLWRQQGKRQTRYEMTPDKGAGQG